LLNTGFTNAPFFRFLSSQKTMADQDIVMDSPRKKAAYDPDQDPEEKRVLRQKYRVLLKDEEGIFLPFRWPFYKERKRR
jgi:hypothetical protein